MTKFLSNGFIRFVAGGAANTALSYLVYRLLLLVASYEIAYSASYVAGLIAGYFINAVIVFRVPLAWMSVLRYPIAYLIPYLVGLLGMRLLVSGMKVDARIAPFVVMLITVPLAYVLAKRIIGKRGHSLS